MNAVRYHDGKRKTFKRVCGHNARHAIFDDATKNLRIEMVPQASSGKSNQCAKEIEWGFSLVRAVHSQSRGHGAILADGASDECVFLVGH